MRKIAIFGTSGMAREAGDIVHQLGMSPIYIAHNQDEVNRWTFSTEIVLEADTDKYVNIPCVIGIGDNLIRQRVAQRYSKQVKFCNLVHPSATFGYLQKAAIENSKGIIICAGARLTNNIQIGDFTIINQNSTIAHDTEIGGFSHLAPGSVISGNVKIESGCWIGAGAVINQGLPKKKLTIGENTMVGSGAVVIRSCQSNSVYAGIPAKRIK